ncbi:MAG TPA: cytochrome c3 family protein [Anaeromyxobacter sp.]|nr:cytochrome c3 family protein [Anaeromyxobacter sp.]
MKKILVALAVAAFASSAFAAVSGSKHDFTGSSGYSTGLPSRCQYCHIPHHAQVWANTALWALPQYTGTLTFYSSGITSIDIKESQTCLSCHGDGATATSQLNAALPASARIANDGLANDHPIGNTFTPGSTRGIVNANIILAYSTFAQATASVLECAGCHNPHNSRTYPGRKLLAAPPPFDGTGDFCGQCHTR